MKSFKWAINPRTQEQALKIAEYLNKIHNKAYSGSTLHYYLSEPYFLDHYTSADLKEGYTKITFDEFLVVTEQVKEFIIDTTEIDTRTNPLLKKINGELFLSNWNYILFPFKENRYSNYKGSLTNLPIISYNIFKLMQTETKKIIGYKFNASKEFIKAACAIEGYSAFGTSTIKEKILIIGKDDNSIEKLKTSEVLDIWFEPVYEQDFKEGDYVVILDTTNIMDYDGESVIGKVFQLDKGISANSLEHLNTGLTYIPIGNKFGINFIKSDFRLATEEEIKNSKHLKIGAYTAEYNRVSNKVFFGCQGFTKEELQSYKNLLERPIRSELKIQDVNITVSMLDSLIENL